MADQPKTLEMRVAELEDKLAKLNITEDDMKAYHKVAAALGTGPAATPALSPQVCTTPIAACLCILRANCIFTCQRCWTECTGCGWPVVSSGAGGFGTLGGGS